MNAWDSYGERGGPAPSWHQESWTTGSGAAGWATGYLHPQARLIVIRADRAEVERFRTLHQVPRGQHNRRPWLSNQAALIKNRTGRNQDSADEPRL